MNVFTLIGVAVVATFSCVAIAFAIAALILGFIDIFRNDN